MFEGIQEFPVLFVRTLTFSVFERCNELPIWHWSEQYLAKYLLKIAKYILLTQN